MKLGDSVIALANVGVAYERKLSKLGIGSVGDMLNHIPRRFLDFRKVTKIREAQVGELVTVRGEVVAMLNQYTKRGTKMQIAEVSDESGKIKAVWFNQPYLVRNIPKGSEVSLAGEVSWWGREKALIAAEYETSTHTHTGRLVPIYPATAGVSSKWMRGRMKDLFEGLDKSEIKEHLDKKILKKYGLVKLEKAYEFVHFPDHPEEYEWGRERLAFGELLTLQTRSLKRRKKWKSKKVAFSLKLKKGEIEKFISSLPFKLTKAQQKVVGEILLDMKGNSPMNRLLEGDVGSGKTVVAAIAMYGARMNGMKTLLMAPTQILARQHFDSLKQLFSKKVKVGLVTGSRKMPKTWDVLVGTHSLLTRKHDDVGLVVIDEQHRFGVRQRGKLVKASGAPHILTMTATPIPRTVALSFYGDMDLSVIDELPKGRKKVTTWVVPPEKREGAYGWIEQQVVKYKSQAFVICPLIEESEKESMKQAKAATQEYENLKDVFANLKLGLLHGRIKEDEKNKILGKFKNGKIDILVSTPVVEVGVDIPNATIMMVEAADRFGLASLHQLRGRVGRGEKKSYCLLLTESESPKVEKRLSAMKRLDNGFELAEADLKLRGPGEIFGTRQSGLPELKHASWTDVRLIKAAREVAKKLTE